jgi:FkbM family methyltransferase
MDVFQQKYLETIEKIPRSRVARMFSELKDSLGGRPLARYGAGTMAKIVWADCKEFGPSIACICDSAKTGTYVAGSDRLPILNMQALKRDHGDATVVISSYACCGEIYESLIQNGFAPDRVIQYPTNEGGEVFARSPADGACDSILKNFEPYLEGHRWAYGFYQDELSRQLVLDRMRMHLLIQFPPSNTSCHEYYEDGFISLAENEVFVDGGAFDGDSAEAFIAKMKEADKGYSRIYAFEPSNANHAKARERLSAHPGIELFQKGLWSKDTELPFFENDAGLYGSSFVHGSERMTHSLPVASLDSVFKDKSGPDLPSFIKLDVEGAEKEALLGAAAIISRAKPKLAICAYHKPEDIYELPQTIMGIHGDYKFALRHHHEGPWNTILYAV